MTEAARFLWVEEAYSFCDKRKGNWFIEKDIHSGFFIVWDMGK